MLHICPIQLFIKSANRRSFRGHRQSNDSTIVHNYFPPAFSVQQKVTAHVIACFERVRRPAPRGPRAPLYSPPPPAALTRQSAYKRPPRSFIPPLTCLPTLSHTLAPPTSRSLRLVFVLGIFFYLFLHFAVFASKFKSSWCLGPAARTVSYGNNPAWRTSGPNAMAVSPFS